MNTKCKRVEARLTYDDFELLKKRCNDLNINKSEFFRYSIKNFVPDRKLMANVIQLIFEIKKIGTNINQIAKYANQTSIVNEVMLKEELNKLDNVIENISFNLLKANYGCNKSLEN